MYMTDVYVFINFINVFYKWIVKRYWIAIEIALYKYCIIIIIIIITWQNCAILMGKNEWILM